MGVKAGKLWQEITIQQRDETINDFGESEPVYVTFKAMYAKQLNTTGNEVIQGDQVEAIFDTVFEIRAEETNGIRANMRVKSDMTGASRFYNIVHDVDPDQRGIKQKLFCKRLENITNG